MERLFSNELPEPSSIHTVVMDFDGVFTNNKVWLNEHGEESVCCDRGDGLAFDLIRGLVKLGQIETVFIILSSEANQVVKQRALKLRITCVQNVSDKSTYLHNFFKETRPFDVDPMAGVIYLGNDLNDLSTMRRVKFSVAPCDAHPRIKSIASLVIDKRGGDGFVRSFVESFLRIDNMTEEQIDGLISDR